jgi:ferrous iron transport protein A
LISTAANIQLHEEVEILSLDENDTGQRLGEMGFWPGKAIELIVSAPFGDPLAFKVDNTVIALRKEEAELIQVKALSETAA